MQPPQTQEVDGTPPNSIGGETNSKAWIDEHLDKLLGQSSRTDADTQFNRVDTFFRTYSESLDEEQIEWIECELEHQLGRKREKERSRRATVIANYNATIGAGPCDPATNQAISFDPTLPTTQQSKRCGLCAKFPRDVKLQYKRLKMWHSKTDQQNFIKDKECKAIVKKYKAELADNPGTIVVPQRKFPCRRPVSPYQQSGTVATPTKATQATPALAHPVATKPPKMNIDKPALNTPSAKRFRFHAGMSVNTLFKALARLREPKRARGRQIKLEVTRPRHAKVGQGPTNVTNPPAAEPLALTPAELTRVREFTWKKVKRGAKAQPGRKPPPVKSSNQFGVLGPTNVTREPTRDVSRPRESPPIKLARPPTAVATTGRDNGNTSNQELKRRSKEMKEAKRQQDVKQQAATTATR